MGIKGFQGTSLLDYPGRIASLVFFGQCNLTCPFCHNPDLVLNPQEWPDLDRQEVLASLSERRRFIDGVVVSGGEPTLAPDLEPFLDEVKQLGLKVKLDSNGLAPKLTARLLDKGLVDYLAIDLKTSISRYAELHDGPVSLSALRETVALALAAPVEVEFRTTCVPGWVDAETIRELGELIDGAPFWALQQYHAEYALDVASRKLEPYTTDQLRSFAEMAEPFVGRVELRGL